MTNIQCIKMADKRKMDCSIILQVMYNALHENDSSDDEDDIIKAILQEKMKCKRVCVRGYFEDVIPRFPDDTFR